MLGRIRRTTRLDVGLALTFVGVSYLVWALVAGVSRAVMQEMIRSTSGQTLPKVAHVVKTFFVDSGFVIDIVGLVWMTLSLVLLILSSRQRCSISWSWVSAASQTAVAALGATLVGWAAYQPHIKPIQNIGKGSSPLEVVSSVSLPVLLTVSIFVWITCLVWLLVEQARLNRRGPTLRDGLRSNIFR